MCRLELKGKYGLKHGFENCPHSYSNGEFPWWLNGNSSKVVMDTLVWVRSQEGVPREKKRTTLRASGGTSNLLTAGEGEAPMCLQIGRGVTRKAEGNSRKC